MICNKGYVYDRNTRKFWDKAYRLEELQKMDNSHDPDMRIIRDNLYKKADTDDDNKIVFVNDNPPYFRSKNDSEAKRYGFSSNNESLAHYACKEGISQAEKIRIKINNKDYTISKKESGTEVKHDYMGWRFESDCEYKINGINNELEEILHGDLICFEIHNKSEMDEKKIIAYRINGLATLEFDVPTNYLPIAIKDGTMDPDEAIRFLKEYYEDTEKHYIKGTYYSPINQVVEWDGLRATVNDNNIEINISVYKDRFENRFYNVFFSSVLGKYTLKYFGEKRIETVDAAKKCAAYTVFRHLNEQQRIPFKQDI